jgi:hypothetical protein
MYYTNILKLVLSPSIKKPAHHHTLKRETSKQEWKAGRKTDK